MNNLDPKTVESFGDEWQRFDQSAVSPEEVKANFDEYFAIFPWEIISDQAEGFDMGCGTGRWAQFVAPRVAKLHCVEPSAAINVAKKLLDNMPHVTYHQKSLDQVDLQPNSQDFGYSLGVLHHVPDTAAGIASCVQLLKPGAPLLLYLYYAFDQRPYWFRLLWRASDCLRRVISRLPTGLKNLAADTIALMVYWPLSRLAGLLANLGLNTSNLPLNYYRNRGFYTLRTDARDRFGTPLEQRFTREQIERMMLDSGLERIVFSEQAPYWCAVGYKKSLV